MNDERSPGIFDKEPGVRTYALVCLGGLLAILAGLTERGAGLSSLFPAVVGILALFLRWKSAPVWLVLSVIWVLWASERGLDLVQSILYIWRLVPAYEGAFGWRPLSDASLCVGVLLYAAGNYRLQGLVLHLFSHDPRVDPSGYGLRQGPRRTPRQRRSVGSVSGPEIVRLLIMAAACTAASFLFWLWLGRQKTRLEPSAEHWRVMVLVWLFGVGLIVAASVFGYLGQRRMPPDEAALYLQDVVWRETPREQRRLMAWLAWARLRRKKREVEP